MFNLLWPLLLAVGSNTIYQICAKSVPSNMDPFASLTVTYGIGCIVSLIMYYVMNKGGNILEQYSMLNWAPIVLGFCIVCLEVAFIYAYKNGWQVSSLFIIQAAFLAAVLIVVGFILYQEAITWNKIVGVLVCLGGLYLINMK